MQIKKYFFPLLFIIMVIFLLDACNLALPKPDTNISPTHSGETPIIPTNTAKPASSPTSTLTSTPPITIMPTLTLTLLFAPTATPTPKWLSCPGIVIKSTNTNKGEKLHILRCEDGFEYDLGPLAKGIYSVGPNDKFIIYITIDGLVYGTRVGDPQLNRLYDLGREHIFTVFNKGVTPDFEVSFIGEALNYKLVLFEKNYYQKRVYNLPSWITY